MFYMMMNIVAGFDVAHKHQTRIDQGTSEASSTPD
jgi:hypothetical protein